MFQTHCVYDSALSDETCKRILECYRQHGAGSQSKETCDLAISRLPIKEDTSWLYKEIQRYLMHANQRIWNIQCTGFETLQLNTYEQGQSYTWHLDITAQTTRKLSTTVMLSGPSEYAGGDFELLHYDKPEKVGSLNKGSILVFPSYMAHRVTPLTRGKRQVLVSWAVGDPFK